MRRAGTMLILALIVLIALSVTVWAAWGDSWRSRIVLLGETALAATPTPTRTPRPGTVAPTLTVVEPPVVAFTPTSAPTPVPPTATPATAVTPEPLPADLAAVAAAYGIDPARRFIVIDPNTQQMTIWEPGQPVRKLPVSTGDEERGYRTPAWYGLVGKYWGTFHAFGVYADEGWYLYEDSGSVLIHGAPYKLVNGQKVYQELDAIGNYPASRGCIRLRPEDARWFTEWKPEGVPLVVLPRR